MALFTRKTVVEQLVEVLHQARDEDANASVTLDDIDAEITALHLEMDAIQVEQDATRRVISALNGILG